MTTASDFKQDGSSEPPARAFGEPKSTDRPIENAAEDGADGFLLPPDDPNSMIARLHRGQLAFDFERGHQS